MGDHCPALPGCKSETKIGTSNFCGLGSDYDLSYRTWKLLAAKIQRLEKTRGELLTKLSKADITINEATKAKDFYRCAPSLAVEKRLIQLHERLGRNVDRALRIRDNNQILTQCALNAVQVQLNKIGGATLEPTYGSKGGDVVTHKKNFDFKA